MSQQLSSAWSRVLDVKESEIQESDNFFEIGGDSVKSMRLVSAAQDVDIDIDAETIFNHPTLFDMMEHSKEVEKKAPATSTSQSSLEHHLLHRCAIACQVDPALIEDIFPSSDLQTRLLHLHLSAEKPGGWLKQLVFEIAGTDDASKVKAAFQAVRDDNQALRTRLVRHEDHVVQVIMRDQIHWEMASNLAEYLAHDISTRMNFGGPLTRYAVVHENEKTLIVWTAQHCVEDEWTRNLLFDGLEQFLLSPTTYSERPKPPSPSMYASYLSSKMEEGKTFWQRYMGDSPNRSGLWDIADDHAPTSSKVVTGQLKISGESQKYEGMPLATIAHGAFGLACAELSGNLDDVTFITVRMGRQIPLKGVELMMGPILCFAPLRVQPASHGTILEMLQQIQRDFESMRPYERLAVTALQLPTNSLPILNWRMNDTDIFDRKIDFEVDGSKASLRISRKLSPPHLVNLPFFVGARFTNEVLDVRAGYDEGLIKEAMVHQLVGRFLDILGFILERSLRGTLQDVLERNRRGDGGNTIERQQSH